MSARSILGSLPGCRFAGSWSLAMVMVVGVGGCGPTVVLEGATEGSSSEGSGASTGSTTGQPPPPPSTTGDPTPPATSTTLPPEETMGDPDDTGVLFLIEPDGGGIGDTCDVFAQDCPPGEKCLPKDWGSGIWDDTTCSLVGDDPDAVGEPCLVVGNPYSGIDSCDFGAMCWDVDPDTLEGTCVSICGGDEHDPVCPADASCAIGFEGTVAVCLPGCNPLLQDCGGQEVCYGAEPGTACMLDDSGGAGTPGSWCEFPNECQPGATCVPRDLVLPGCPAGPGCCTAFCDLNDPMPPCLAGQTCQAWFEPGLAPMGLTSLGFCGMPV